MLFMKGTPDQPRLRLLGAHVRRLNALGVKYAALDILPDPRIREELSALSGWPTIPQLFVDGELVGGCDIVTEMYETGELAELLGVEQPEDEPEARHRPQGRRSRTTNSSALVRGRSRRFDERPCGRGRRSRAPASVALPSSGGSACQRSQAMSITASALAEPFAPDARLPQAASSSSPLEPVEVLEDPCESWTTSSPCTSTGTRRWPVRSSISGRSRFRNGTRTSS